MACRSCSLLLALTVVLCLTQPSILHANYVSFELDTTTATHKPILADVNGDGLIDLIVPRYDRRTGRELHIHHQTATRDFERDPQRIEVKSDMVAFAVVDIRPEVGKELILITPTAVFSLSTNIDGFVGNAQHLADWPLVIREADPQELLYLPTRDINGDARRDLALPGHYQYGIFLNNGDDELIKTAEISMRVPENDDDRFQRHRDVNAGAVSFTGNGFSFSTQLTSGSQYASWINRWSDDDNERTIVNTAHYTPTARFANFNSDKFADFYYYADDDLVVNVQRDDGSFDDALASSDSTGIEYVGMSTGRSSSEDSRLRFLDFDADGDTDIVEIRWKFRQITLRLFRNDGDSLNLTELTQILKIKGMDVVVSLVPKTPYQKPLLAVTVYSVPLAKVLSDVQIHRTLLLFAPTTNPLKVFADQATTKWQEEFQTDSATNMLPHELQFDIDSDGRLDVMSVNARGVLTARSISDELALGEAPFWEYVPERAIHGFEVRALNNDSRADLIIEHANAIQYLIHDQ